MKNTKLLKFVLCILISSICTVSYSQKRAKRKANEDTANWKYEIECVNISPDGSYIVKVFSYSKKKHVAVEQSKKNAVHGIVFKGVPQGNGCASKPALSRTPNAKEQNRSFYDTFFTDQGEFQRFVSLTTDGAIAPGDRYKVGKNQYKVGLIVTVDAKGLRKYLEQAGVIRSLSSGF